MYHGRLDLLAADVAIVGAGPGGAWAAYSLARRGARVLLIDPSHPREKPCGGGVTGRALRLVHAALGGQLLPAAVIRSVRFIDSALGESARVMLDGSRDARADPLDGSRVAQAHPLDGSRDAPADPLDGSRVAPAHPLVVASRLEFDGALLALAREAGAELLAARVTDIDLDRAGPHAFRIETAAGTRHAAQIIGADGANSLVRRRLARPFGRNQLSIATGFFAHGVTSTEIVIELLTDPPGYVWSFPRPTHLAVGVCAQADAGVTAEALRGRLREWMQRTDIARGARLEAYSWPIPSLGSREFEQLAPSGPGWYLVGDAAGLVDPITREGIYFALLSGQWAAEAAASGAADAPNRYAARVRDDIATDLGLAARFKAHFFRRRFTRLMLHGLLESPRIRGVMADLVAGLQSYSGLKWRLLQTFEIGLALRLARSCLTR